MKPSPDKAVSQAIVTALHEGELISDDKLQGLAERVSGGSLRATDWRCLAEADATKEEGHATAH